MDYLSSRKERSMEKENQEKEFLIRTKKYGLKELETNISGKRDLIDKLKKILSKKYNLEEQEYIILIDKFKLDNITITKKTIEDLIGYLNMELQFNLEESLEKNMEEMVIINELLDKNIAETLSKPEITTSETIKPKQIRKIKKKKKSAKLLKSGTTIILDLLQDLDLMNFEGNYEVQIKYPSRKQPSIMSISKIVLSNNIIAKYKLHMYPYIFIKIREFNNNIFINKSQKYYFNYFSITNNTIIFPDKKIFIPPATFNMSNLNISFYDHTENLIKILDFDEDNDFFKIFLNMEF